MFRALMSTKNLARTAIEGGRCGHYQSEVRERQRSERTALRAYLRDPDESRADPRRKPVSVCFSDKLAPVRRYLESQAGRPWDKVRGELFARFDTRTTPGRHVLFDHVLRDVEDPRPWSRTRYPIDAYGILRRGEWKRPRRSLPAPFDRRAVERWLGARRVRQNGARFVWHAPLEKHANAHAHFVWGNLVYVVHDAEGQPIRDYNARTNAWEYRPPRATWLPRGLLSRTEESFLRALPEHAVAAIVSAR